MITENLSTLKIHKLTQAQYDRELEAGRIDPNAMYLTPMESVLQTVYPVGAIYLSANNISPASLFGGTWEQIEDVFLLGAGSAYTAGSTGGESTHTLTVQEMPSHTHTFQTTAWVNRTGDIVDSNNSEYIDYEINRQTQATGGSQPHNNMPPYLVVYMWKRIE